jgi:dihydroorotase
LFDKRPKTLEQITLTTPDDWHLHVRDGAVLKDVVPDTARCFARAIIMPNLKPPVTTVDAAMAYRQRILQAAPEGSAFQPLMTLYLTDNTRAEEIHKARDSGHIYAVKYYPAGATTHSDAGVTDIRKTFTALAALSEAGLPLLVHGEVTDPQVDIFDREKVFIDKVLQPVLDEFPDLKIVFEHITTEDAVQFVETAPDNVAATVTPQHLLYNRNALFKGGIRPHYFCLPVLKRERHRHAVVTAATSGNRKFFLGTDSAPHAKTDKESACGCAGIYSAHAALELYAEAFETAGALDKLEAFASVNGATFYGLPRNGGSVTLRKTSWEIPAEKRFGDQTVVPLRAGEQVHWQLVDNN